MGREAKGGKVYVVACVNQRGWVCVCLQSLSVECVAVLACAYLAVRAVVLCVLCRKRRYVCTGVSFLEYEYSYRDTTRAPSSLYPNCSVLRYDVFVKV